MLRQELQHVSEEVSLQQQGIRKLEEIDHQVHRFGTHPGDDNQLIAEKISAVRHQLEVGERERHELLNKLLGMKNNFNFPELPGEVLSRS